MTVTVARSHLVARRASARRPRARCAAWAAVAGGEVALVLLVVHVLAGEPAWRWVGLGWLAPLPLALGLAEWGRASRAVDRLLVATITLAGLTCVVVGVYLLVVLGLGRAPTSGERTVLVLSLGAAAVAALLWAAVRRHVSDLATRLVFGQRHAPDEVLRTFSNRLTRATPLDELLLQLAESLRATLELRRAEIWTGSAGSFGLAVSDPEVGPRGIALSPEEESIVVRAGVSGTAWARVWLAPLLEGRGEALVCVAPVAHGGELLGLIVAERSPDVEELGAEDALVLGELARQVGVALHNVRLDSALQATLDELRRQADELRASRARLVAAADAERRRIELDIHDGAQPRLVAIAMKLREVARLADGDEAAVRTALSALGAEVDAAIEELRDLAHGIYPPLLADLGLGKALPAAAKRAGLPVRATVAVEGRYAPQVEAAVYFCCLEALQNAAKHAGAGTTAVLDVREDAGGLLFMVSDDGAGFDARAARGGIGLANMGDRLGAIGGTLRIESRPGGGTAVTGSIPVRPPTPTRRGRGARP